MVDLTVEKLGKCWDDSLADWMEDGLVLRTVGQSVALMVARRVGLLGSRKVVQLVDEMVDSRVVTKAAVTAEKLDYLLIMSAQQ